MARTAFISGITGQDGAYLARLLIDKGYHVTGGVRCASESRLARLRYLGVADKVEFKEFELAEHSNIRAVIEQVRPDEFYNLGAQSSVSASFERPLMTAHVNAIAPMRILEICCEVVPTVKYFQASSAEMFGCDSVIPQTEQSPFHPCSPYGSSKVCAHNATVNYRVSHDMFACSGILFGHESPLRARSFVVRKVVLTLARIAHGEEEVLEIGNLDVERDWGFAGDFADGMWRALQHDHADDYVFATGQTHSVRDLIALACGYLDIEIEWRGTAEKEVGVDRYTGRDIVRVNPKFFRPSEAGIMVGNAAKACRVLGWQPSLTFERLVELMVRADVERVEQGSIEI